LSAILKRTGTWDGQAPHSIPELGSGHRGGSHAYCLWRHFSVSLARATALKLATRGGDRVEHQEGSLCCLIIKTFLAPSRIKEFPELLAARALKAIMWPRRRRLTIPCWAMAGRRAGDLAPSVHFHSLSPLHLARSECLQCRRIAMSAFSNNAKREGSCEHSSVYLATLALTNPKLSPSAQASKQADWQTFAPPREHRLAPRTGIKSAPLVLCWGLVARARPLFWQTRAGRRPIQLAGRLGWRNLAGAPSAARRLLCNHLIVRSRRRPSTRGTSVLWADGANWPSAGLSVNQMGQSLQSAGGGLGATVAGPGKFWAPSG